MSSRKKYAIFGGSFNPVQKAHVEITKEVIENLKPDKIFIVPASMPPHKPDAKLLSFSYRFKLLRMAFEEQLINNTVQLSIIEKRLPSPGYTVNTMKIFKNCFPEAEFSLIMGHDMYNILEQWYEVEYLTKNFQFIIAERENDKEINNKVNLSFKKGISFLDHQYADLSSTTARELLTEYFISKGSDILSKLKNILPENVLHYIIEKKLYSENIEQTKST